MTTDCSRSLPEALTQSINFVELTEKEVSSFKSRLAHIEEICERAESWLQIPRGDREATKSDARTFFDHLELHLSIIISPSFEKGRQISTWFVHSSWTPDFVGKALSAFLSDEIISGLDAPQPAISSEEAAFCSWLAIQISTLRALLSAFYDGDNYPAVFANLLGIDIVLANLLAGVTKARLTQFWASSA